MAPKLDFLSWKTCGQKLGSVLISDKLITTIPLQTSMGIVLLPVTSVKPQRTTKGPKILLKVCTSRGSQLFRFGVPNSVSAGFAIPDLKVAAKRAAQGHAISKDHVLTRKQCPQCKQPSSTQEPKTHVPVYFGACQKQSWTIVKEVHYHHCRGTLLRVLPEADTKVSLLCCIASLSLLPQSLSGGDGGAKGISGKSRSCRGLEIANLARC